MLTTDDVLSMRRLEDAAAELATTYQAAEPFPHVVIDDVLRPEAFSEACDEFHGIHDDAWTNYLHVNERKFAVTDPAIWGPAQRSIAEALFSARFVRILDTITGFDGLIADRTMDGGGLHRSIRGGYLNVHADFTAHHAEPHWRRRVNLLLYLNPAWDESWGGALELWPSDMRACAERIVPRGNRMVLFSTTDESFHGHPEPMTCPDGVARQSLALYYFTADADSHPRPTNYRPRPDDSLPTAARIAIDNQALHAYDAVKRKLHLSDRAASRWLGAAGRMFRK